ncbi:Essential protein Yae1, N terminal [Xylographa opegraphella]|nr:Essential protein Yae1, N terminal [Xylographa opegraphella]
MLISTPPHTFPIPHPATTPPPPSPPLQSDLLSDIFSSSPSPPPSHSPHPSNATHPSDIPRLRSQHSTAGYRDGLSVSKTPALQPGFDEGYTLGAVLGLKAGELLGMLEGMCAALKTKASPPSKGDGGSAARSGAGTTPTDIQIFETRSAVTVPTVSVGGPVTDYERLTRLRREAAAELDLQRIFAAEFWGPDGLWSWAVPAPTGAAEGTMGGDGGVVGADEEVTFEDVAAAHPLIRKWGARVQEAMREWGVRKGVWAGEEWEAGRDFRAGVASSEVEMTDPLRLRLTCHTDRGVGGGPASAALALHACVVCGFGELQAVAAAAARFSADAESAVRRQQRAMWGRAVRDGRFDVMGMAGKGVCVEMADAWEIDFGGEGSEEEMWRDD